MTITACSKILNTIYLSLFLSCNCKTWGGQLAVNPAFIIHYCDCWLEILPLRTSKRLVSQCDEKGGGSKLACSQPDVLKLECILGSML